MNISRFYQQFLFWSVWLVIPLIWEILTGFISTLVILVQKLVAKPLSIDFLPVVSILIPVYKSRSTLEKCLQSIADQEYPNRNIEVILIDNGNSEGCFEIFTRFQEQNPQIRVWWQNSQAGKSKALNKGIFSSSGKYIINIDSDGWLDKDALRNIVTKFENDSKITCLTGVVVVEPLLIEQTHKRALKILKRCELFEYLEVFLVGRNFASIFNSMYTVSGAFSCFRREALLKTQLYNSETMGEDTHMTYQIRNFVGGKILLCANAFFFVDPIENMDKLYLQRQRWQRGEIEVASLFHEKRMGKTNKHLRRISTKTVISDHTLTFPRMMWFFALIYLYFINYPPELIIGAAALMYACYVINGSLFIFDAILYLKDCPSLKRYVQKHYYIVLLMPVYRFLVFWIRIAGIINSLTTDARWRASTLSEEFGSVRESVQSRRRVYMFFYRLFNKQVKDSTDRNRQE